MNLPLQHIARAFIALLLILMSQGQEQATWQESETLPWPEWSEEDLTRIRNGENLINGSLFSQDENDSPIDEQPFIDLPAPNPDLANQPNPSEIPDEALEKYFLKPVETLLLDPQGILSSQEYLDTEGFLKYHADESKLNISIYLFDVEQKVPSYFQLDTLLKRHEQNGKQTAVIYYFYGAPERTELHLTAEITGKIGNQERMRCLQNSINVAMKKSQDFDQLEAFCVQMSIMVYRLEKAIDAGQDLTASSMLGSESPNARTLTKPGKLDELFQKVQPFIIPLSLIIGVSSVAWIVTRTIKLRKTYTFEEFEIAPRLGADHAAGVGGVISYAPDSKPISVRKANVPDYLNHR